MADTQISSSENNKYIIIGIVFFIIIALGLGLGLTFGLKKENNMDCSGEFITEGNCINNKQKKKYVITTQKQGNGASCPYEKDQIVEEKCQSDVNCVGSFIKEGECVNGRIKKKYVITTQKQGNGANCPYEKDQIVEENCQNCIGDYEWKCEGNISKKIFKVSQPASNGGRSCIAADGYVKETGNCQDCQGDFVDDGQCTNGSITKKYVITKPADKDGRNCPHQNGYTKVENCQNCNSIYEWSCDSQGVSKKIYKIITPGSNGGVICQYNDNQVIKTGSCLFYTYYGCNYTDPEVFSEPLGNMTIDFITKKAIDNEYNSFVIWNDTVWYKNIPSNPSLSKIVCSNFSGILYSTINLFPNNTYESQFNKFEGYNYDDPGVFNEPKGNRTINMIAKKAIDNNWNTFVIWNDIVWYKIIPPNVEPSKIISTNFNGTLYTNLFLDNLTTQYSSMFNIYENSDYIGFDTISEPKENRSINLIAKKAIDNNWNSFVIWNDRVYFKNLPPDAKSIQITPNTTKTFYSNLNLHALSFIKYPNCDYTIPDSYIGEELINGRTLEKIAKEAFIKGANSFLLNNNGKVYYKKVPGDKDLTTCKTDYGDFYSINEYYTGWSCAISNNNLICQRGENSNMTTKNDCDTVCNNVTYNINNQSLISKLKSNFTLDVDTNINKILMNDYNESENKQKWILDNNKIKNIGTGKCLDNDGTNILHSTCDNKDSQKWFMDSKDRLKPYNKLNKCLDITNSRTINGATLQLFDCNDNDNQKWSYNNIQLKLNNQYIYSKAKPHYVMTAGLNENKVINDTENKVMMLDIGYEDSMLGNSKTIDDRARWTTDNNKIKNVGTGKCLDNDGTNIFQSTCDNNKDSQKWVIDKEGKLKPYNSSKCINLANWKTDNGNHLVLWDCSDGQPVKWQFDNGNIIWEKVTTNNLGSGSGVDFNGNNQKVCRVFDNGTYHTGRIGGFTGLDDKCYYEYGGKGKILDKDYEVLRPNPSYFWKGGFNDLTGATKISNNPGSSDVYPCSGLVDNVFYPGKVWNNQCSVAMNDWDIKLPPIWANLFKRN